MIIPGKVCKSAGLIIQVGKRGVGAGIIVERIASNDRRHFMVARCCNETAVIEGATLPYCNAVCALTWL